MRMPLVGWQPCALCCVRKDAIKLAAMHVAALLRDENVLAGMIAALCQPSPQHSLLAQARLLWHICKRLRCLERALEPPDGNLAVSQIHVLHFEPAHLTGAHPM